MKYFILLPFHMNIKSLNVFQTPPFRSYCFPDIATWSYQRRGIHLVITSWHIFPVHPFTLAPFFAFRLICLSDINKSFVMKMSYLLHRAKLLRVTFFMKGSYLPPRENLHCHISRTRHTSIPVFVLNWDLVISILYTKNRAISSTGTWRIWPLFVPFDPAAAAVTFFRCPAVLTWNASDICWYP